MVIKLEMTVIVVTVIAGLLKGGPRDALLEERGGRVRVVAELEP